MNAIRAIALAAVCAAAMPAMAQYINACTGAPTSTPPTAWDFDRTKPLVCEKQTLPTIRANSAGVIGWRYCKAGTTWSLQFSVATWEWIGAQPARLAELIALQTDIASVNAAALKYVDTPLLDAKLRAVWCPFLPQMVAGKPADTPPPMPATWFTPATGSGTIYTVVNRRRSTIVGGKTAPRNAPCDCTSQIQYLTATFCPLQSAEPSEVTQCEKR